LIREFDNTRGESLVQDENRHLENNLEHHGSRRAYRDDGQVVMGRLNLTRVLGGNYDANPHQVTQDDIDRGYFMAVIRDPSFREERFTRVRLNHTMKQPVSVLFSEYQRGVQALQGLSDDIKVRIMRKWTLTLLRFCTMPLRDALIVYEASGNREFELVVDSPRGGKRAAWSFYEESFTEFFLFTEMLKKVISLLKY
jgi:hypothetical protein